MGTSFEIRLYAESSDLATQQLALAFAEIERVEAALSHYRPTSEISRINVAAPSGPVTTDPEVFSLLARGRALSVRSDGAFDLTLGQLVKKWGFLRGEGRMPSSVEILEARSQSGWQHLELRPSERSVRFLRAGLTLDLSSVGKGYALDRAASVLRSQGVVTALLGGGQSSYVAVGSPPGESGWLVTISSTSEDEGVVSQVRLHDAALSTSGALGKFFELDGRRYGHILDPRTGWPVETLAQVSVVASDGELSDTLATTFVVLGADSAPPLARELGVRVLFVDEAGGAPGLTKIDWPPEWAVERVRSPAVESPQ